MTGGLDLFQPAEATESILLRLMVAAALGGLIGIERERAEGAGTPQFAGVRTFPLFCVLGAVLVLASGQIGVAVITGFVAVAALVTVSYFRSSRSDIGTTTETAALATYWVGVLAGAGALLPAAVLGIGMTVLLASKERLEAFPRGLSRDEVRAALVLAVIAAVVLPLLPDARYGPWGVWNPRHLWGIVVLVCGFSFLAFIGMRIWGEARGLYVSGLLGGLVSSTAVTVSFATRSREEPARATPLAVAAGLASLVMLVRVGTLTAIAGPAVLPGLAPFLGAALAGGVATVAVLARRGAPAREAAPGVASPFRLSQAIRFTALYALVLLAVEAASRYTGAWGVVAAAVLAGLTDVDAITLALASAAGRHLRPEVAASAIALAVLANTAAKAAYALWLGSAPFRRTLVVVQGAAVVAGTVALAALLL
ncbi:MAG: DUF4010 domain-containing protein [Armatimonadota bacterium]|nr:DUF4010 domain-containing protein [Armatimonadota bacterium]MDR7485461.1 DUF4010 domain-containing protein [Armatimonadota bacterium]MDR7533006.1 DUF4010 domain-containing protein [Armatimonadota bacterium]MDR7536822.1 DUF4010 domain-containing protein [Armatimonadota bacterium]